MVTTSNDPQQDQENAVQAAVYFSTPIYTAYRPEFLDSVKKVSRKHLKLSKDRNPKINDLYPVRMTNNYFDDPSIADFVNFVGQTSWGILKDQGYNMNNMMVQFTEMWTQEHHQGSQMDQHTHRFGSQIVGFYFLDVPPIPPRAVFYDPRPGALQGSLPEADPNNLTMASSMINYEPKPGLLLFTNSWLAHSFTKNASKKPFRFVHFNIAAMPAQVAQAPAPVPQGSGVEVV